MRVKIKSKKPQLVTNHRDKLAKEHSSVNRRVKPSFMEAVFSIAILVGVIALIWYLV